MTLLQKYRKALLAVALILLTKLVILVVFPITGDEAYFVKWGQNLMMGYYDHPPMVGWLIYLMRFISHDVILYRLFSVMTAVVMAYVIYLLAVRSVSKEKAFYVALIFLASPIDMLMLLFTNDIALAFFGTIGAYLFVSALEREAWWKRALGAGVFLGLAFLSKYFAVFLIFALYLYALITLRQKAIKPLLLVTSVLLVFAAQNLYFNYNSCWNNIMFNFIARPKSEYHPELLLVFFGIVLYLFTPWGLWMLLKSRFQRGRTLTLIATVLGVSFTIFFVVSLKNTVGLHWFLLFVPYMYLLFVFVDEARLKRLFTYNVIFTMLHGLIVVTVLLLPLSLFEKSSSYSSIVYGVEAEEVCKELEPYRGNLFSLGYTPASVVSYNCDMKVHMLFNNSKYGRLDDALVDVRTLDKKDIMIFNHRSITESELSDVCETVKIETFEVAKATFYLAECENFSYERYKAKYLDVQRKKFYNIPSWLPKGECYFEERYYR